jgi:branched-chain amino acid transport system ATP-binding protein
VSATIAAGAVTAVCGPNGAGKTTLLNAICGFEKVDAGEISYNGRRLDRLSAVAIARLGIGRLFQDVRTFNSLTVLENVLLARRRPGETPLQALAGRQNHGESEHHFADVAMRQLRAFELADKVKSTASTLSFGQRKLLAIARLLCGAFDVFLLDEPFSGVSPHMAVAIEGVVTNLALAGKIVVIVEHDPIIVQRVAAHAIVLREGRVVAAGAPETVLAEKEGRDVRAARSGQS